MGVQPLRETGLPAVSSDGPAGSAGEVASSGVATAEAARWGSAALASPALASIVVGGACGACAAAKGLAGGACSIPSQAFTLSLGQSPAAAEGAAEFAVAPESPYASRCTAAGG